MYGYSYEELLSKSVEDLVPPEHWPEGVESGWRVPDHPVQSINLRADGERFPVEITGQMQNIDGEEMLLIVVRDITQRKRASARIGSGARFLARADGESA